MFIHFRKIFLVFTILVLSPCLFAASDLWGCFYVKQIHQTVYHNFWLKGHWTGSPELYGNSEGHVPNYKIGDGEVWNDLNDNGVIYCPPGPIPQPPAAPYDYTRPFIFKKGTNFQIGDVTFRGYNLLAFHLMNQKINITSDDVGLDKVITNIPGTFYVYYGQLITGKVLDKIASENIEIKWTIGNCEHSAGYHEQPEYENDMDRDTLTTNHKMYVIGANNISGALDHTLVDLGCEVAANKTTDDDIFDAIWAKISDKQVPRIDKKETPGNNTFLKYWGPKTQTGAISGTGEIDSLDKLLANEDGNCYSWTELVKETLRIQGVTTNIKEHVIFFKGVLYNVPITIAHKTITQEGEEETHDDTVVGFLQKTGDVQGGTIDLKHPVNLEYSGPLVYKLEPIVFGNHSIFSHYSTKDARTYYYDPGPGKGEYENIPLLIKDGIEIATKCPVDENNKRWVKCVEFTENEIKNIFKYGEKIGERIIWAQ